MLVSIFSKVALNKKVEKLLHLQAKSAQLEKECPYCFKSIDSRATKCAFCASILPSAVQTGLSNNNNNNDLQ
jgi:phage FluMu protein Com